MHTFSFPSLDTSKLRPVLAEGYHERTAQALGACLSEYFSRIAVEDMRRMQNAAEYTPATLGAAFVLAAMDLMLFISDHSSLRHMLTPRAREEYVRQILCELVNAITADTANVTTEESDA